MMPITEHESVEKWFLQNVLNILTSQLQMDNVSFNKLIAKKQKNIYCNSVAGSKS